MSSTGPDFVTTDAAKDARLNFLSNDVKPVQVSEDITENVSSTSLQLTDLNLNGGASLENINEKRANSNESQPYRKLGYRLTPPNLFPSSAEKDKVEEEPNKPLHIRFSVTATDSGSDSLPDKPKSAPRRKVSYRDDVKFADDDDTDEDSPDSSRKVSDEVDDDRRPSNIPATSLFKMGARKDSIMVHKKHLNDLPGVDLAKTAMTKQSILKKKSDTQFKAFISSLLSVVYGMVVMLLGVVTPLSEISSPNQKDPYLFEGFYVYMYTMSIIFMGYVYIFFLRRFPFSIKKIIGMGRTLMRAASKEQRKRKRKQAVSIAGSHESGGSFYLRLGAVAFGGGSMILTCLEFGEHVAYGGNSHCTSVIVGIRLFSHLMFTFLQLCFIFLNAKLCINRFQSIARFGMMHMVATNLIVWVRVIVKETIREIKEQEHHAKRATSAAELHHTRPAFMNMGNSSHDMQSVEHVETCTEENLIGRVVHSAVPYLYPCRIEYSLIAAGTLYVMWKNIGTRIGSRFTDENADEAKKKAQKMHVDCSNSSRGMFFGLLALVGVVISMILFFVFIDEAASTSNTEQKQQYYKHASMLVEHFSEILLYLTSFIALVIAAIRMRNLRFNAHQPYGLEETLILLALIGDYIFGMFSIIAATFSGSFMECIIIIVSNVMGVGQATSQAVFIVIGIRQSPSGPADVIHKPGKQCVMFILFVNMALWGINTFEVMRAEANPIQSQYYGHISWNIFMHISLPLMIFYRFHSTACLSNIWKNAWKRKTE